MQLLSLPLLFLDAQTSGLSAASCEIIELGWADALTPESIETRLIRPKTPEKIPQIVFSMTGLSAEALERGEPVTQVWKEIRKKEAVATVIHYSQFEISFLEKLNRKIRKKEFPWPILCTHQIAKRLYPDLPARSLRAISGHFGYSLPESHRSHSHIAATQIIWKNLVVGLKEREKIETLPELLEWLNRPVLRKKDKSATNSPRKYLVDRLVRLALPDSPGIYEMFSRDGKLLYIGKATSLKTRVNSYFQQQRKTRTKLKELMTQVADIKVTPTSSTLEASLLETDKIKACNPPYNISLKTQSRKLYFFDREFVRYQNTYSHEFPHGPHLHSEAFDSLQRLRLIQQGQWQEIEPHFLTHPPEEMKKIIDLFLEQHASGNKTPSVKDLLHLARLAPEAREDEPEGEEAVYRKLRRTLRRYRYARWLTRLGDCEIYFRRQNDTDWRHLRWERGVLRLQESFQGQPTCSKPIKRSLSEIVFDIATYDRLRVFLTELLDLHKKGADIHLFLSEQRQISTTAPQRFTARPFRAMEESNE